jgi:hypothetical protein
MISIVWIRHIMTEVSIPHRNKARKRSFNGRGFLENLCCLQQRERRKKARASCPGLFPAALFSSWRRKAQQEATPRAEKL